MTDAYVGINDKFDSFLRKCNIAIDEYCFDINLSEWENYLDLYEYLEGHYE